MSAENAWRIAMEEAAQSVLSMPEINRQRVAASLQALLMPPAFRAAVEAEVEELRGMLARCVAAMGGGARYEDDIADMLEYGEALEEARALLSRLEAKGESQ